MIRVSILILCAVIAAIAFNHPVTTHSHPSAMVLHSQVGHQNVSRLQRVMQKAARGEPVTLGFIGGSITAGERASRPDLCYVNQVTHWWMHHFPGAPITCINAGIAGTGSAYGCLRATRDLLCHHPDFVVVEFGVNDRNDLSHAETYEGLIRQIISDSQQPAVMLLFMMHHDGTNAQEFESAVGTRYALPMVSFRDAVWPQMLQGRLKWADLFADSIHPNDRGHQCVASCIDAQLDQCLNSPVHRTAESSPAPNAVFSDLYAHTNLTAAADLNPVNQNGWAFDAHRGVWRSNKPGAVIEFEMAGRVFDLLYNRTMTNAGSVSVSVDNQAPTICDAWFDSTWAGYVQVDRVSSQPTSGRHRVRIELLNEKNLRSNGSEFEIVGLGSAGDQCVGIACPDGAAGAL